MQRLITCLAISCALATAGCDKGGPKGSGDVSQGELSLLKLVPGGNVALFGGNYIKMQHFMSSTMGKAITAQMKDEKAEAWMACFTQVKDLKIGGGLMVEGSKITMRIAFAGLKLGDVADCAKKAGFATTLDPDNKFVSIDITSAGMTMTQNYLQLPSGELYSRMTLEFGMPPRFSSGARPELESDVAGGKPTAADDSKLLALAAKVDRSKTFWFAGSGANTPISSKLGELYGAFDLDSGLSCDLTVELLEPGTADKIADAIKEMKKSADKMPADLKDVIEGIDFSRDGNQVRFRVKLSEKQLTTLMSFGGMAGMGRKHRAD